MPSAGRLALQLAAVGFAFAAVVPRPLQPRQETTDPAVDAPPATSEPIEAPPTVDSAEYSVVDGSLVEGDVLPADDSTGTAEPSSSAARTASSESVDTLTTTSGGGKVLSLYGIKDAVTNAAAVNAAIAGTTYDFVVIGGGTAGLALAARLSERSSVSVLVLEAGGREDSNPRVTVPGNAGQSLGQAEDWGFSTVPQTHVNGRSIFSSRGKGLGGSSAINFMVHTRGHASEYNAWASLGGAQGWNWNSVQAASLRYERYQIPQLDPLTWNFPYTQNLLAHGYLGPVDTSMAPYIPKQYAGFVNGIQALGVPYNIDVDDGSNHGLAYSPVCVNPNGPNRIHTRETSHTAYINPIVATRKNLLVVTRAHATKINWGTNVNGKAKASGASFLAGGTGSAKTVKASKEVILSAGSFQSPQLLELSGVGNTTLLSSFGIATKVNLPGVGENLQDHLIHMLQFRLKPGYQSNDDLGFNATYRAEAEALYQQGKGPLSAVVSALAFVKVGDIMTPAERSQLQQLVATPGQDIPADQLAAQVGYLLDAPITEPVLANSFFGTGSGTAEPGVSYIAIGSALQHAFSRGNVHISSSSPTAAPRIDPRYLSHPADVFIVSKSLQFIRKIAQRPEFAPYIASEQEPGPAVTTEAQWQEWSRTNLGTEWHPLGTCSMLPQNKKGVVDSSLKVYGTTNVRVVDLSVIPLHVSTHPMSLVYGIAERASTIILAAN